MGNPAVHTLEAFTFGSEGLFFDAIGEPCLLLGTVEFQNFVHALDESFEAPLGRRLIYAATDSEERAINGGDAFQFGRWFGKRRAEQALKARAKSMGWGWIERQQILGPAHDGLCVGFSLAHAEHLSQSRHELEWNQRTPELIQTTFKTKQGDMLPAPPSVRLNWSDTSSETSALEVVELDLDVREATFFCGEARSFFVPTEMMHHLIAGLCGRPVGDTPSLEIAHVGELEQPEVFRAVVHAAMTAYNQTDFPIYLQTKDDWFGHLSAKLTMRGFGTVEVEKSILDGDDMTRFLVRSPAPAIVAGTLLGMWHRAHGKRFVASFHLNSLGLVVEAAEPTVDY